MANPQITLLIGSAASGKTGAALRMLAEPRSGSALVLVSGALQRQAIKQRLTGQQRVRVYQFEGLALHLLKRAGFTTADLNGTAHMLLLRAVLRNMSDTGALSNFASVARKPGFIATVGALISEAQQAEISPQALAAAGVTPYDGELGAIYAAYCAQLEQRLLTDSARRLELARDALRGSPDLLKHGSLLIVDGFDQFTPLQLGMLSVLTQAVEHTVITLTGAPDQSADRPAHRRFVRTRKQLIAALNPTVQHIDEQDAQAAVDAPPPPRAATLDHIATHLFDLQPSPLLPADDTVQFIEAADREREVRAVLRQVKKLLEEQGAVLEQVALLLRREAVYVPLLREVAAEYGLPLAIDHGLPLIEAPSVAALLTLLRLPLENFPYRALSEVWRGFADGRLTLAESQRAPFDTQALSFEQAAHLLDRVARDAGLSSGLPRLQARLQALTEAEPPPDEDDPQAPAITPEQAAALRVLLDAFVALLAPPPQAPMRDYVAWLRVLGINAPPAVPAAEAEQDPHGPANRRLLRLLEELAGADSLLDEPAINAATFVAELEYALRTARYAQGSLGPGRIAVLSVLAARGLHFDHVFILGMADGEFPLKLPSPPLYSRRERAALARKGVPLIPPDPADERSLFYETVARARRHLILSRTYLDSQGNPLPASPYVGAVDSLFHKEDKKQQTSISTTRSTAGSVPVLKEAASPSEQLAALMQEPALQEAAPAYLLPLLAHVRRACQIERCRESTEPYGPFEGLLDDGEVIAILAERFGTSHLWSVTQFNNYITCPFRFAAAHILRLEQRGEPEEGLSRAGFGRVNHKIMAKAGRIWQAAQHLLGAENEPEILAALRTAADEVLAEITAQADFVHGTFWAWEQDDLRQRLERAVRRMVQDEREWSGFRVAAVEQDFNPQKNAALKVDTPAGPVLVVGRIDRLDQREDTALALIDYKSSSAARSLEETTSGRDVQLSLYLLAAEQIIAPGQQVELAAFLHLGSGKRSRPLTSKQRSEALNALYARLAETVQGVRTGDFAVRPRDKCPPNCAFEHICRRNLAKRDANQDTSV